MNIIVVDDCMQDLQDVIGKIRSETHGKDQIYGFTDPQQMLAFAAENACGAAFLKVEMRSSSGLETAQKLKQIQPKVNIIFESAFDCYMKNAFDIRCSGYIMMPARNTDIQGELENLRFARA